MPLRFVSLPPGRVLQCEDMSAVTRSPEYDLLLDAVAPLGAPRAEVRDWDSRHWGSALHAADWHRLSPLLFCHLESNGPRGDVPPAVRSALERAYLANAARNMFIAATLRRVVDVLDGADLPAMPLKGAALAATVYPDPAQREMLDLDVLVPPERLEEATVALASLGYRPRSTATDVRPASVALQPIAHHDEPLVGEERLVAVELHRHVALEDEGGAFAVDGFWQRARPALHGAHVLPASEDLLLHVCLHFTRNRLGGSHQHRHTGGALGQICDIARIVEHERLDWPLLVANARSYHLQARVFLALFSARELGVQIPAAPLEELRPPGFSAELGRRLVALRVLRAGDHLPVRSLRWMLAPSREVLSRGWNADPTATMSLARAYLRRARANAPLARSAVRKPWLFVQDQRLNGQIHELERTG